MVLVVLLLLSIKTFTVKSHFSLVLFSRFPVLFPTFSNVKFKASVEESRCTLRIPDNKGRIINEGLFKVQYLIKLTQYFGNLAKALMRSHNKKILELSFQNIG